MVYVYQRHIDILCQFECLVHVPRNTNRTVSEFFDRILNTKCDQRLILHDKNVVGHHSLRCFAWVQ